MYIYYQHHRDANGKVLLTELIRSSYPNGRLGLAFKRGMEEAIHKACIPIHKWPPLANYSYDPSTFIWSYFGQYGINGTYGEEVLAKLEAIAKMLDPTSRAIEVVDLVEQVSNGYINLNKTPTEQMKPEDFFYNHGVAQSVPLLSGEALRAKLVALLGSTEINKKTYRQAALAYHPDRNNGDGSKMSELNMLWQLWQKENAII